MTSLPVAAAVANYSRKSELMLSCSDWLFGVQTFVSLGGESALRPMFLCGGQKATILITTVL